MNSRRRREKEVCVCMYVMRENKKKINTKGNEQEEKKHGSRVKKRVGRLKKHS